MCHRQLNGRPCAGCLGFVPLAQVKLMLCGSALLRGRPCGTVVETEETKKKTTTTTKRTRKRKATGSPPLGGSGLKEAADVNIINTNITPATRGGNSRGRGCVNSKKQKVNNNNNNNSNGILLTSELTSQTVFLKENDFLTHNGGYGEAEDQDQQLGDIILHIPKIPALPPGVDFATADPRTTGYILCNTCAVAKAEQEKPSATAQLDVPRAPGNAVLMWKDPDGNTVAGPGPPPIMPPPPPRPAAAVLPVPKEGEYEVEDDDEPAYDHHDEVANEHGAEQEDGGLSDADGSTDPDYDPPRTVTERDNSTNNDHNDDNNEKKSSYNERHDEAVLQSATTDRVWAWVQMAVSGKQGPGVGRRVG